MPRILDYQIAGIIAGGLAGEVAYLILNQIHLTQGINEPLMIIIGAIFGFFFWGALMRLLR